MSDGAEDELGERLYLIRPPGKGFPRTRTPTDMCLSCTFTTLTLVLFPLTRTPFSFSSLSNTEPFRRLLRCVAVVDEHMCASGNLLQEFGLMGKHAQLSSNTAQASVPQDYFGYLEGMLERG
jgi:hypothetical protein